VNELKGDYLAFRGFGEIGLGSKFPRIRRNQKLLLWEWCKEKVDWHWTLPGFHRILENFSGRLY